MAKISSAGVEHGRYPSRSALVLATRNSCLIRYSGSEWYFRFLRSCLVLFLRVRPAASTGASQSAKVVLGIPKRRTTSRFERSVSSRRLASATSSGVLRGAYLVSIPYLRFPIVRIQPVMASPSSVLIFSPVMPDCPASEIVNFIWPDSSLIRRHRSDGRLSGSNTSMRKLTQAGSSLEAGGSPSPHQPFKVSSNRKILIFNSSNLVGGFLRLPAVGANESSVTTPAAVHVVSGDYIPPCLADGIEEGDVPPLAWAVAPIFIVVRALELGGFLWCQIGRHCSVPALTCLDTRGCCPTIQSRQLNRQRKCGRLAQRSRGNHAGNPVDNPG